MGNKISCPDKCWGRSFNKVWSPQQNLAEIRMNPMTQAPSIDDIGQ